MPAEGKYYKNTLQALSLETHQGQFNNYKESNYASEGNFYVPDACRFSFSTGTGGPNADITTATTTQNLVLSSRCPSGMRPYLINLRACVIGAQSWSNSSPTSIPYLSIQDTNGYPGVHIPFCALRGNASLAFPNTETTAPLLLGPASGAATPYGSAAPYTFTYSAGVITMSSSVVGSLTSASSLVGTPVEIVSGTGLGQTAIVTAVSGAALTISPAFLIAPDTTTSIVALYYQPLQAYSSTTSYAIYPGTGSTPYTANVFDNGFNILGVAGSGQNESRPISASTTAGVLTGAFALNSGTTFAIASSIVCITNESNLCGAIDMVCDDMLPTFSVGSGLQAVLNLGGGMSTVGSNVRLYGDGFWGY